MEIADILRPERIACNIDATSKKRAFEKISNMLTTNGASNIAAQVVCESFIAREKLGSTSIGSGVAIPHGRIKNADKTVAAFIQLHDGIDYDAVDDQQVDLLFALIVPENAPDEHLKILAELAEMFSNDLIREKLRSAKDSNALFNLLRNWKQYCKT